MSNVSQRSSAPERRARRPVPIAAFLFVVVALAAAIQHTTAAENIYAGQTCSDKVYWNKSHLCGYAPGTGTLRFTNTGVHEVAIFTLPAFVDTSDWNGDITGPFGIDALAF